VVLISLQETQQYLYEQKTQHFYTSTAIASTLRKDDPTTQSINLPHTNNNMSLLQGKVALVTGGGKNLGAETARELAKEGVTLAIHYNSAKSKSETETFANELQKNGTKVSVHVGDLTTASACEKLF